MTHLFVARCMDGGGERVHATPGPSRARWMEGGGTVRLHHQRQLGLFTARGICMRTLRIPSIIGMARYISHVRCINNAL